MVQIIMTAENGTLSDDIAFLFLPVFTGGLFESVDCVWRVIGLGRVELAFCVLVAEPAFFCACAVVSPGRIAGFLGPRWRPTGFLWQVPLRSAASAPFGL